MFLFYYGFGGFRIMAKSLTIVLFVLLFFALCFVPFFLKKTKYYTISSIFALFGLAFVYLISKSYTLFLINFSLLVVAFGAILLYLTKDAPDEFLFKKNPIKSAFLKTFVVVLVLLFPFTLYLKNTQFAHNELFRVDFLAEITKNLDFNSFLVAILLFALLNGFYTIAFWRKK